MPNMPIPDLTEEEIGSLKQDVLHSKSKEDPVKSFLLMTQKGPEGSVLDVKPLWENFYRLNFWKKFSTNDILPKKAIVESRFVQVDKKGQKYIVKDLTKKGK